MTCISLDNAKQQRVKNTHNVQCPKGESIKRNLHESTQYHSICESYTKMFFTLHQLSRNYCPIALFIKYLISLFTSIYILLLARYNLSIYSVRKVLCYKDKIKSTRHTSQCPSTKTKWGRLGKPVTLEATYALYQSVTV